MKPKDLIKLLVQYEELDIDLNFKLVPNDGTENDGDCNDVDIKCVGEIYTGGLYSDKPYIDIGFQIIK
jgi:hypothetical protein